MKSTRKIFIFLTIFSLSFCFSKDPFDDENYNNLGSNPLYNKKKYFTTKNIFLPSSARKVLKISVEYQNVDGTMGTKSIMTDGYIDWHYPLSISPNINYKGNLPKNNKEKSAYIDFLYFNSFFVDGPLLKIATEDKMIRSFVVSNPTKLIFDFKKDIDISPKVLKTGFPYYTKVFFGSHKGFYRIAFELDGKYRYDVERLKDGYLIELR